MKRTRSAAAVAAAAAFLAGCSTTDTSPAGLPGAVPDGVIFHEADDSALSAPEFELPLLAGEVLDAADAWAERPMVLVFFESWCEICRDQQAGINELAEEYEDVVLFVGIADMSTEDEVREYVADNDVPYPVGIDDGGEIWLDYAAEEPPLVALVTKDGYVARGWPGGIDPDRLADQIGEVLVADAG